MSHILVVDDEPAICWSFRELLRDSGHEVTIASSAEDAIQLAKQSPPDAIVMDVRLPGQDGISAISELQSVTNGAPVIVMTAFGNLETAVRAVENGAFDYLTKPFDLDDAARLVTRALQLSTAGSGDVSAIPKDISADSAVIGSSPLMQDVFKQVALVAGRDVPVLITGESGTGKELVARAIHRHSQRSDQPFLPISLPALNPASIESELFGEVYSSRSRRTGLLELADGGTVLLDEVGDIPVETQLKLLRAIEQQEIIPVGEAQVRSINVRILATTNRDLEERMASGEFREDLFYRLSVVRIALPTLRDRPEDIPELTRHFLRQSPGARKPSDLSPAALCELAARPWPGNVRELKNTIENAAIMTRSETIEPSHLPAVALTGSGALSSAEAVHEAVSRWARDELQPLDPTSSEASLHEDFLDAAEPALLAAVLEHCGNNRAATARLLGLHRATLRQKLKNYGIGTESDQASP